MLLSSDGQSRIAAQVCRSPHWRIPEQLLDSSSIGSSSTQGIWTRSIVAST